MTVRAQDQMERLCLALPHLDDDSSVPLEALAQHVGTTVKTLLGDLHALNSRDRDVAGFVESVELYLGAEGVGKRSSHFHRPTRLTRNELAALDLGLGLLALERPLEERSTIAAARRKIRLVAVTAPRVGANGAGSSDSSVERSALAAEEVPAVLQETFAVLWQAQEERRAVRLHYVSANARSAQERVVHPFTVCRVHQHIYVIGLCTTVADVRVFRLDRITHAELDNTSFDVPADFDVDAIVRDGHVFSGELPDDELVVRYSPRIARWIAEREGVRVDDDGSLTVHWPLLDDEWAVRHVLQYGGDAQVIAPSRVRTLICERLDRMRDRP